MVEITVYALVAILLASMTSGMIVYERFINRSLRTKSIDSRDERITQWRFVITTSLFGLSGGLIGSIGAALSRGNFLNIIQILGIAGLATIGFSLLGWLGFWIIDILLRARIKIEIQREAKGNKFEQRQKS